MIIYKTTNLINGKIYIGKDSRNIDSYYGSGIVLNHAIKKYGKENFKKETLDKAKNAKELNEKEIFWIKKLDACNKEIGYNRSYGGDGFSGITQETREKLKISRLKWKFSNETKKKMSESSKGVPKSESHKKSLSKAWKKRKIEKPFTKETLEKMSNSMMGKNIGKYIKIYEFKDINGKIFTTNEGLVKFCKSIHKHPINFRELIKGDRKKYHGWTYIRTIKE